MSLVRRVWPLIINTFSRHKPSSLCSTGSKHVFKHVSGYLNILPDALWPSRAHTVQRIKSRLSHSLSEFVQSWPKVSAWILCFIHFATSFLLRLLFTFVFSDDLSSVCRTVQRLQNFVLLVVILPKPLCMTVNAYKMYKCQYNHVELYF